MSVENKSNQLLQVIDDIRSVNSMLCLEQVHLRVLLEGAQGLLGEGRLSEEGALNISELLRELGLEYALHIRILHGI